MDDVIWYAVLMESWTGKTVEIDGEERPEMRPDSIWAVSKSSYEANRKAWLLNNYGGLNVIYRNFRVLTFDEARALIDAARPPLWPPANKPDTLDPRA